MIGTNFSFLKTHNYLKNIICQPFALFNNLVIIFLHSMAENCFAFLARSEVLKFNYVNQPGCKNKI